ncbi:glycine oxidase ThiO [Thalassiella azotivora]
MSAAPDLLVVGCGVVGASVAWEAVRAGLTVTVVDDAPGAGATHAAAGMLAPTSELVPTERHLLDPGRDSLERYPGWLAALAEVTGEPVALREAGALLVAVDPGDVALLDEQLRLHTAAGVGSQRLTSRRCRALEPALGPRVSAGVVVTGDRSVDARALHAVLLAACLTAGVEHVPARAAGLAADGDGRVRGVRLADGRELTAGTTVLAAGARSGQVDGVPPEEVPVRPVKGQVLRLRGPRVLHRTVRAHVHGRPVYLVPTGEDGVVVGATVEERGFDTRVTAGAVLDLLHDATLVVPELTEYELADATARSRPTTPDNLPVVGRSRLPGLVHATGHHRHGVLLAPLTAAAVVAAVTGQVAPEASLPFCPSRFRRPSRRPADQEVHA